MKHVVPDTNLIVRLVVGDVKEQQTEAIKLFRSAEAGLTKVVIMPIVVAESCFVLNSFYKKSYEDIADTMEGFLSPSWLEVEHREALRGMWGWYRQGMHFVDSYLLALEKYEAYSFVSFDKKMTKKSRI